MQFASNLRENGASRAAKRSLQTRTRPLHRPRKTTGTIKSPEAPRSCPQISPRNVLPRRLLACQLADIAYFAEPSNQDVLQTALDAYALRVQPGMPTQELTVYIQHMLTLKSQLKSVMQ